MKKTIFTFLLLLANNTIAQTQELDRESTVTNQQIQMAQDLPQTVVVRVNTNTKEVQVLQSKDPLPPEKNSIASIENKDFMSVPPGQKIKGELDRDSSRNSWYFYWGYNNYFAYPYYLNYYPIYSYSYYSFYTSFVPSYFYGGYTYNYRPYYWYPYGSYYYGYYRWL